jgi:hypothetical protein
VLTTNDSDQPQSLLDDINQPSSGVSPGDSNMDTNLPETMDYTQRLAWASAERTNLKIQVTQAYSPQISPLTSGPDQAVFGTPPPPYLAESGAVSSDAMDISESDVGFADSLNVNLQISDTSLLVPAQFVDLDISTTEQIKAELSTKPKFVLSNICMRESLDEFVLPLTPHILSLGQVLETGGQNMIQRLANTLTEHRSVAIAQGPSLLFIFYPSNSIKSVFLERTGTPLPPDCHICVEVRTAGDEFSNMALLAQSSSSLPKTLERLFQKNHGWKAHEFFMWHDRNIHKNVYIMAHPTAHKSETEMLARYFRELGANVWLPVTKGSWKDFQGVKEGVIIVS